MSGATKAVVDFVMSTRLQDFPEAVIREGKRCMIDGFGVTLAGSTEPCSRILREHLAPLEGTGETTTVGEAPRRLPAALSARVNGTSGHAMDYDDTQLSNAPERVFGLLTHPTIPPLSAAFAVGEEGGASGERFLEAFLTGFEVSCKVAEAIDPDHYQRGFHSSGTIGAFGAAAAAAKLTGLDAEGVERAIGIAAGLTGGIRVSFGTMMKPLHVGRAAENGVLAAELAARGYTSGAEALDGKWGFFQVAGGGFDPDRLLGALGRPYSLLDPGVSVKPYPSGSLGHPSMDAMLEIVTEDDVQAEQIERVEFRAGHNILGPLRYPKATNALEAKFCIPFILSSIALRRRAGIREFVDDFVRSEAVRSMMDRVELIHDPEIEAEGYDRMRSRITVHLKDGRSLTRSAEVYRGGPERPLTREELHGKFHECASLVLDDEAAGTALELIESVESLGDLPSLARALAAGAPVA